ncbi:MAG: exodeoxyribonuclease III, partial [Candidatus Zixiibacteriota bacterium]
KYKMDFYCAFRKYVTGLREAGAEVLVCGDVNTAHREIDLARPKENEKVSGFLPEERDWISALVADGFLDTFRVLDRRPRQYSWWDMKTRARERNVGWRIDYWFASHGLGPRLRDAYIKPEVELSDHSPVGLRMAL